MDALTTTHSPRHQGGSRQANKIEDRIGSIRSLKQLLSITLVLHRTEERLHLHSA
jgi:hypothetical protein